MLKIFNSFMSTGGDSLTAGLLAGRTSLIIKDVAKGSAPSNFRPITCLSSVWKLFSSIIHHIIYHHLESNDLLTSEQKGCYRGSRGTKDQLLVDKLVLTEAHKRHKNLYITWLDFHKAFDSVSHDWILKCSSLYGIHPKICGVIATSMQFWRTTLTCNNVVLGDVNIRRGIFQGDSLSPLLFVLALMPMSHLLCQTNKGYIIKIVM